MSMRKILALALSLVLAAALAAPALAAEEPKEAEILWLPDGVTIPPTRVALHIPEFNWLSAYRDAEGEESCIYDLTTGTFVEEYDSIHPFSDGLATVYKDGMAGCIDLEKNLCVPCVWDSVWNFHDGTAVACLFKEWSDGYETYSDVSYFLIDAQGRILQALDWETANADPGGMHTTSSELTSAHTRSGWVFLDENAVPVFTLDKEYSLVGDFLSGLAMVESEDGRRGFIDRTGREVVPCRYDDVGVIPGSDDQTARYSYVVDGTRTGLVENPDWTGKNDAAKAQQTPFFPVEVTAYPSTQTVEVDGAAVEFQMYALKDAQGNDTNYIKLRDLAAVLDLFDVGWEYGMVTVTTDASYTPNGSEGRTPYAGPQPCAHRYSPVEIDWMLNHIDSLLITDENGGGYTYFQLRELGWQLGFNVDWSPERGVYVETDKPYQGR